MTAAMLGDEFDEPDPAEVASAWVQLHTSDPGAARPAPLPGRSLVVWNAPTDDVVTFAAPDRAPTIVLRIDVERAVRTLRVLQGLVQQLDEQARAMRREQRRIGLMYRSRQLARRRRNRNR